jgi:methylene-fatty-acyl-phospholipid synthase
VFQLLGREGAFYGSQFGKTVPWSTAFPFSILEHPQYIGAVLTIWGVFLLFLFPFPDWWVIPSIETVYYAAGARLECSSTDAGDTAASSGFSSGDAATDAAAAR